MIDYTHLINQAKTLAETAKTEVERREAIRIAYYAVFHFIQHVCIIKNYKTPNSKISDSHEQWIEAVNPSNTPSGKEIEQKAKRMKKARITADYRLNQDISADDVKTQIHHMEKIILRLNFILKAPAHLKIIK